MVASSYMVFILIGILREMGADKREGYVYYLFTVQGPHYLLWLPEYQNKRKVIQSWKQIK